MRSHIRIIHRFISIAVVTCFSATSVFIPSQPSYAGPLENPVFQEDWNGSLASLKVPNDLGQIEDSFQGNQNQSVILIRDAHSIPDAQRNIRKLIDFFVHQYGIQKIGVEGAAETLDAQIFRSFPDQERLQKVIAGYAEKGELSGSAMAAILSEELKVKSEEPAERNASLFTFHASRISFQGLEDWDLYEQGTGLYLEALAQQPALLNEIEKQKAESRRQKQESYPQELFRIDQALEKFYENRSNLLDALKALSVIRAPLPGSELELLLKKSIVDRPLSIDNQSAEINKIADQVAKALKSLRSADAMDSGLWTMDFKQFNAVRQQYQTSQITGEAFALRLTELIEKYDLPIHFSGGLQKSSQDEKRLRDIEGSRLMRDFDAYIDQSMEHGAKGIADPERSARCALLYARTKELRLLEKLIKLELTKEEWNQIREELNVKSEGWKKNYGAGLSFYLNAEERDQALFKNMDRFKALHTSRFTLPNEPLILVAGGFHTEGLAERLKRQGISYIIVRPAMQTLPEHSLYQQHMQGEVSWSPYFEVEDGNLDLYKAFVRATRDTLIQHGSGTRTHADPSESVFQSAADPRLLKLWRDQILRDLAKQNDMARAGEYTRFLDEVTGEKPDPKVTEGLARLDQFISGLKKLYASNQVTQQNILNILNPATVPPLTSNGGLGSRPVPARIQNGKVRIDFKRATAFAVKIDSTESQVTGREAGEMSDVGREDVARDVLPRDVQRSTDTSRSEVRAKASEDLADEPSFLKLSESRNKAVRRDDGPKSGSVGSSRVGLPSDLEADQIHALKVKRRREEGLAARRPNALSQALGLDGPASTRSELRYRPILWRLSSAGVLGLAVGLIMAALTPTLSAQNALPPVGIVQLDGKVSVVVDFPGPGTYNLLSSTNMAPASWEKEWAESLIIPDGWPAVVGVWTVPTNAPPANFFQTVRESAASLKGGKNLNTGPVAGVVLDASKLPVVNLPDGRNAVRLDEIMKSRSEVRTSGGERTHTFGNISAKIAKADIVETKTVFEGSITKEKNGREALTSLGDILPVLNEHPERMLLMQVMHGFALNALGFNNTFLDWDHSVSVQAKESYTITKSRSLYVTIKITRPFNHKEWEDLQQATVVLKRNGPDEFAKRYEQFGTSVTDRDSHFLYKIAEIIKRKVSFQLRYQKGSDGTLISELILVVADPKLTRPRAEVRARASEEEPVSTRSELRYLPSLWRLLNAGVLGLALALAVAALTPTLSAQSALPPVGIVQLDGKVSVVVDFPGPGTYNLLSSTNMAPASWEKEWAESLIIPDGWPAVVGVWTVPTNAPPANFFQTVRESAASLKGGKNLNTGPVAGVVLDVPKLPVVTLPDGRNAVRLDEMMKPRSEVRNVETLDVGREDVGRDVRSRDVQRPTNATRSEMRASDAEDEALGSDILRLKRRAVNLILAVLFYNWFSGQFSYDVTTLRLIPPLSLPVFFGIFSVTWVFWSLAGIYQGIWGSRSRPGLQKAAKFATLSLVAAALGLEHTQQAVWDRAGFEGFFPFLSAVLGLIFLFDAGELIRSSRAFQQFQTNRERIFRDLLSAKIFQRVAALGSALLTVLSAGAAYDAWSALNLYGASLRIIGIQLFLPVSLTVATLALGALSAFLVYRLTRHVNDAKQSSAGTAPAPRQIEGGQVRSEVRTEEVSDVGRAGIGRDVLPRDVQRPTDTSRSEEPSSPVALRAPVSSREARSEVRSIRISAVAGALTAFFVILGVAAKANPDLDPEGIVVSSLVLGLVAGALVGGLTFVISLGISKIIQAVTGPAQNQKVSSWQFWLDGVEAFLGHPLLYLEIAFRENEIRLLEAQREAELQGKIESLRARIERLRQQASRDKRSELRSAHILNNDYDDFLGRLGLAMQIPDSRTFWVQRAAAVEGAANYANRILESAANEALKELAQEVLESLAVPSANQVITGAGNDLRITTGPLAVSPLQPRVLSPEPGAPLAELSPPTDSRAEVRTPEEMSDVGREDVGRYVPRKHVLLPTDTFRAEVRSAHGDTGSHPTLTKFAREIMTATQQNPAQFARRDLAEAVLKSMDKTNQLEPLDDYHRLINFFGMSLHFSSQRERDYYVKEASLLPDAGDHARMILNQDAVSQGLKDFAQAVVDAVGASQSDRRYAGVKQNPGTTRSDIAQEAGVSEPPEARAEVRLAEQAAAEVVSAGRVTSETANELMSLNIPEVLNALDAIRRNLEKDLIGSELEEFHAAALEIISAIIRITEEESTEKGGKVVLLAPENVQAMEAKALAEVYGAEAQRFAGSVEKYGIRARGDLATELAKILGTSASVEGDLDRTRPENGLLPVIHMGTRPSPEGLANSSLLNIQFGGEPGQELDPDTMAVAVSLKYMAAVLGQGLEDTSELNGKMLAQLTLLKGASSALFSLAQNQFMIMPQAVRAFIEKYRAELRIQQSA